MSAFLSANSYLGFVAEVTRGTTPATGTVFWIPVSAPAPVPGQKFLPDDAFRGSPVMLYNQVAGVRSDEHSFKSYLYADTFPVYVKALLGGVDTVTPTTASYSHSIPLLNAPATGSQPLSYSICDFDGANYFTFAGAQASDMTLTFGAEVAADVQMKFITNPYGTGTTAPAPFTTLSYSTEQMIPSWDATISIASSPLTYIASGELKIDRKTAAIFTMGTQQAYQNFAGPIEVTGKFTAIVASNADPFSTGTSAYALNDAAQSLTITLTDPNDLHTAIHDSITFQMTNAQFEMPKRTRGKEYLELEVEFSAEANLTDGGTSYAPIKATIVNGVATAF